jgi:hypothetical protein
LNTNVVQVFLQQLSSTLPADVQAVMIWDGAGFHTSGKLKIPDNISVLQMPPYSPELNPMDKPMALSEEPLLVQSGLRGLRGTGRSRHRRLASCRLGS